MEAKIYKKSKQIHKQAVSFSFQQQSDKMLLKIYVQYAMQKFYLCAHENGHPLTGMASAVGQEAKGHPSALLPHQSSLTCPIPRAR